MSIDHNDILDFWFHQSTKEQRWQKNTDYDNIIRHRFEYIYTQAANGELYTWRSTPQGRLAEIIVLDQFPRNMFRNLPRAFATDSMALVLAQAAVALAVDKKLVPEEQAYLYMPYMHSESKTIHRVALTLFSGKGLEENLTYETKHKTIIDRFGRYPHRNEILGRTSTVEELEFLKSPDAYF